jgi:hypothetical protein
VISLAALTGFLLFLGWAFGIVPGLWLALWLLACIGIAVYSAWKGAHD